MARTAVTNARSAGRAVVFNADDFGLTAGVTAGIVRAHQAGLVRSASLMVTTLGFRDAAATARRLGTLDLGVHLTLTGTPPALPPARVPSLVTRDGKFPPLPLWLVRAATGQLRLVELRAELSAQLARAVGTGLAFTHLDSHHHVHLHRAVAPVVAELARAFGLPVVRRVGPGPVVNRPAPPGPVRKGPVGATRGAGNRGGVAGRAGLRRRFLERLDRGSAAYYAGFARADAFRGFSFPATLRAWRELVAGLPPGLTEFMCHPGAGDDGIGAYDGYIAGRETEARWLADPRVAAILAGQDVEVTSFGARFPASAAGGADGPTSSVPSGVVVGSSGAGS